MSEQRFFNRELSWLAFNRRVLDLANTRAMPLFQRLFFLTITASNLDEFAMVRVGGLHLLREAGVTGPDPSGMTPTGQLEAVRAGMRAFVTDQYACLETLREALLGEGLRVCAGRLDPALRDALAPYFEREVFSQLTPVAIAPERPFPLLWPGDLYLACRLKRQSGEDRLTSATLAIIRLGPNLPRLIPAPGQDADGTVRHVWIEDLVAAYLDRLLPGRTVLETACLRITRNADMRVEEEFAADLAEAMQRVLRRRRHSPCVRLEVTDGMSARLLRQIQKALSMDARDTFVIPGPLDLTALSQLPVPGNRPGLQAPPWPPQPSPMIDLSADLFDQIARRDVLLSLPFETLDPLLRLLEAAAVDPGVLAIKIVLYRTARDSAVVRALRDAANAGKSVTAVVELKARFDEASNIAWARELEMAGAQVIYGIRRLKTHAKVALIVRREATGIVRYVHLGTGNYNERTARVYTDVGLLTANAVLAADAAAFFHAVTGCSEPQPMRLLAMAPLNLRERLLERIAEEADLAARGQTGRIQAKINSLVDPQIIEALYDASAKGVEIALCVRGICCLRPGVPGLSERIRVISIVDHFLEHSRIFYFHNGGDPRVYFSSADWMPRSFDRRIELMTPVDDRQCRRRLLNVLKALFADTVSARELQPDGVYRTPAATSDGAPAFRAQEALYRQAREAAGETRRALRTVFEPHLPEPTP